MSNAPHLSYSFEEYVRFERDAGNKHEFVAGLILAMAGGTIENARRCAAVLGLLRDELRGRRCAIYDSNARVRVAVSGNAYYPDASVVCGALEVDPADQLSIRNPSVLVEVLSPNTATYDTTDKLDDYLLIPSLQHVVHVHHDARRVTVYTRAGDSFSAARSGPGEVARLALVDASLSVDDIYLDPLSPA